MSNYSRGRAVEYKVIEHLKKNGYDTVRGASSKGLADVVAIKPGQVLIVNVKRTTPPGPAERAELIRVAKRLPGVGVPLVALGPASQLTFRRLTGPGPGDWVPWVADEIADGRAVSCEHCDDDPPAGHKCPACARPYLPPVYLGRAT